MTHGRPAGVCWLISELNQEFFTEKNTRKSRKIHLNQTSQIIKKRQNKTEKQQQK
jgi:hypothetical protein